MRRLRLDDRLVASSLLFGGLAIVGVVAIAAGWRTAASTLVVPFQVPALVSGGIGGVALVVMGLGLLHLQWHRQWAVDESAELDQVLDAAEALLDALRSEP